MSSYLEYYWRCITADMPKPVSEWWWSLMLKKCSENYRNTHSLSYLQERFREIESCKHRIKNLSAFALAMFFQYFDYNSKEDSYLKNIDAFRNFATEANISERSDLFRQVMFLLDQSIIHCTEEHKIEGAYGETDLHYFLDIDLAVLGSSEEDYRKYVTDLHSEYSFLDVESYTTLRRKVLQSFLLIPNIFATREFRHKYELQAKKNILQELASL